MNDLLAVRETLAADHGEVGIEGVNSADEGSVRVREFQSPGRS